MYFSAREILCCSVASFSTCLLSTPDRISDRCLEKSVDFDWGHGFISMAYFKLEWILWVFLGLFYVPWKEGHGWSWQNLDFILNRVKSANSNRIPAVVLSVSVEMCHAHHRGRPLVFGLKLMELAPWNAACQPRTKAICSHLGRVWTSFFSFRSSFGFPETEWSYSPSKTPSFWCSQEIIHNSFVRWALLPTS